MNLVIDLQPGIVQVEIMIAHIMEEVFATGAEIYGK